MKVLVVGVLGSLRGGTAVRLAMTVEALSRLGDVDLFVVTDEDETGPAPGADRALRVGRGFRRRPHAVGQALRWATRPDRPDHLARLDLRPAADELRRFAAPDRALTWLCKPDAWLVAHAAGVLGPATVCDIDDVDGVRLRSIAALRTVDAARPPELTGAAGAVRGVRRRVDSSRWAAYHRAVGAQALTVVCSDLERRRSGLVDAAVVPNGHPGDFSAPAGEPRGRAIAVFVGAFHYLPNLDAARWVAQSIAPALRRLDPAAVVRIVGDGPPEMRALGAAPGVSWSGPVATTSTELRAASVALVPLRAGSGTRVKIVEAWAAGVPVVSTPLGAEGLDARDGEHLVLAADAVGLAGAVHALSVDEARRQRLAAAGRRRWREAHSPDAVGAAVACVVDRALQSAARA